MRNLDDFYRRRSPAEQRAWQDREAKRLMSKAGFIALSLFVLFLCGFIYYGVIKPIHDSIQEGIQTNQAEKSFRENPGTYSSEEIGDQYYTYDVHTGEIVISEKMQSRLNDGYYRPGVKVLWTGSYVLNIYADDDPTQNKVIREGVLNETDRARLQSGLVFYRSASNWFVYLSELEEWKETAEPGFAGQKIYLGDTWNTEWGVPDFSTAPIGSGYYSDSSSWCYQDNTYNWYIYDADVSDWGRSYHLKAGGVAPNDLKRIDGSELDPSVVRIEDSGRYALFQNKAGYYRQAETVYYRLDNRTSRNRLTGWYQFDSEINAWKEVEKPEWLAKIDPPIVCLGETDLPENFFADTGVADFNRLGILEQLQNTDGYYRHNDRIYFYYKRLWFGYDPDQSVWVKAKAPAMGGANDAYLGTVYETNWNVPDFTNTSIWKTLQ